MSDIVLRTGEMGTVDTVTVQWRDHNNVPYETRIDIVMQPYDKPRTLSVVINQRVVFSQNEIGQAFN